MLEKKTITSLGNGEAGTNNKVHLTRKPMRGDVPVHLIRKNIESWQQSVDIGHYDKQNENQDDDDREKAREELELNTR